MVPMPSSVNSSTRMEWGVRPSMIWALPTPRRTASTQQSILGIMPPEMMPSFFRRLTSLTFTTGIRVLSSSLSRSRPRTSVIKISFMAPNDEAIRAAATSALMLNTSP